MCTGVQPLNMNSAAQLDIMARMHTIVQTPVYAMMIKWPMSKKIYQPKSAH